MCLLASGGGSYVLPTWKTVRPSISPTLAPTKPTLSPKLSVMPTTASPTKCKTNFISICKLLYYQVNKRNLYFSCRETIGVPFVM